MNMQSLIDTVRRASVYNVMFFCGFSLITLLGFSLDVSVPVLIFGGFLAGMSLKTIIMNNRIITYMELVGRQASVIEQITTMIDEEIEKESYNTQRLANVVNPKPTHPDRPSRKKN